MKKIAIVIQKIVTGKGTFGGEPTIHMNLISYLLSKGYQVDVYFDKEDFLNEENVQYSKFPDFSKNFNLYIPKLNKNNYDLIISSKFGLKFPQLKADIYTIHSHSDFYSQKTKFGILYYIIRPRKGRIRTEIQSLKENSDKHFIFCSKQLRDDYCSLANIKNTSVIYPYPNCTPYGNNAKQQNDTFTFGISALGFQNKGGYLILESAFLLKFLNKNFKIKIINKEKPSFLPLFLTKLLGLYNKVEFINKQQDMHEFFNSIDCLVMPSQIESFGMTALEGITFDLPVIISSKCVIQELQENNNILIFTFNALKVWNLFQTMDFVTKNRYVNYNKEILNTKDKYNNTFGDIISKIY